MNRRPPPPGPHGGDVVAVAAALGVNPAELCDLSASLNPFALDLTGTLIDAAHSAGAYPDDTHATAALAEAIGVETDLLVLTNGGSEAIALVASLIPRGSVDHPEFSLYEHHLRHVEPGAPRWKSNPSVPFGRLAEPDEAAAVWDEAYWPMATGTWTRGDVAGWRIGSLTKLWACPGVRIGYVIAPEHGSAARIRKMRPRWSVNTFACATVEQLVPRTDLAAWSTAIARRRSELVGLLAGCGLEVRDTDAAWVLVRRAGLRADLLESRVLVRDCASFGLEDWHRIAVPDDRQLEMLERALDRIAS